MTKKEREQVADLEDIAVAANTLIGVLKIAWGNHYPGGMTEAWYLDKLLDEYKGKRYKPLT